MYSVRYRNIENIDAEMVKPTIAAPVKLGLRNSVRSNIGSSLRHSIATKATSSNPAPTRNDTISVLLQPSSLPRTSAKTSRKSATEKVTKPETSMRPLRGSRDSRRRVNEATIAAIPIGTLTKNTHSQPNPSVSAPPISGPTATAAPIVPPKMPNAVPRSWGGKAPAMSASEQANMHAAPVPCTARARLSMSGVVESPQASDAAMNRARPIVNTSRRPKRSASEPAVSSSAASVSA